MRNNHLDDKGQFRMRLDEEDVEETAIPADVDDLRIEKLNQRVTLISILIPVLIVAVVVIGYMDIKKRVIKTEDTGQLTAESLSKELTTRFESLKETQKAVEENLNRLKKQSDQSVAKVQINLKKLDDRLKGARSKMIGQKELKAIETNLNQGIKNLAQPLEELQLEVDKITKSVQPKITELESTLATQNNQITELEKQLSVLETTKIDKEKMDVALKLEMLKIKQTYKAQLDELQSRLQTVERNATLKSSQPAAVAPATNPAPSQAAGTPATETPTPSPSPGQLQEQTIGK